MILAASRSGLRRENAILCGEAVDGVGGRFEPIPFDRSGVLAILVLLFGAYRTGDMASASRGSVSEDHKGKSSFSTAESGAATESTT